MMLNVLVLAGRLTKDLTSVKDSGTSETKLVNFDIAVDNPLKEADGTRGTTFIQVVCLGALAQRVEKHLHKGSKVAIEGSIQQYNFLRKDGTKGSTYRVVANSVEFLDPKESSPEEAK